VQWCYHLLFHQPSHLECGAHSLGDKLPESQAILHALLSRLLFLDAALLLQQLLDHINALGTHFVQFKFYNYYRNYYLIKYSTNNLMGFVFLAFPPCLIVFHAAAAVFFLLIFCLFFSF